jgi:hypothetical protein
MGLIKLFIIFALINQWLFEKRLTEQYKDLVIEETKEKPIKIDY